MIGSKLAQTGPILQGKSTAVILASKGAKVMDGGFIN
ncbi:hypothetical protein FHS14_005724 [Paenibacillus baekrokdamisoli]|nr:hypothetical protein [Paenibacillus baekrokdamisoli]